MIFRYLSVIDKTRHYYTLCRAASPVDTPPCGTPKKQAGNGNETPEIVEDEGCQPEMEYEDEFEIENQEAATHPATSIAGKNSVKTSSKSTSTPPKTPRISGLKSQVLKTTFLS